MISLKIQNQNKERRTNKIKNLEKEERSKRPRMNLFYEISLLVESHRKEDFHGQGTKANLRDGTLRVTIIGHFASQRLSSLNAVVLL